MRDCITVRGNWMYSRAPIARVIGLVHAGLLSLDNQELTTFPLTKVNEAIEHAAAHAGPFRATLLTLGSV
jgi:alcohol dehydrogenase